MKTLTLLLFTALSIQAFAENAPKKVFVRFNIDRESNPKLLKHTQEIRDALTRELTEKNYIETSDESDADVKVFLNAAFAVEPFTGPIRGCEAFLGVSKAKNGSRHMNISFGQQGLFMNAKRCTKKVKQLFEDIPDSSFFRDSTE